MADNDIFAKSKNVQVINELEGYQSDENSLEEDSLNDVPLEEPQQLLPSYAQIQNTNTGPLGGGRIIGGGTAFDRFNRAMRRENATKEEEYIPKLREALNIMLESIPRTNHYMELIKIRVSRYWFKNPDVLAAACYLHEKLEASKKKNIKMLLEAVSKEKEISPEDIYRYYRLLLF